ncbi:hypothetical protein [Jannaschia sp. LMIT008]|uniref:hypothetical protein n=1 Tax=Jannaschia maritima TaxID=3032585 RepID=UPI002812654E|nr:hypothetical protein [Jannaschia sp. LMIT008]
MNDPDHTNPGKLISRLALDAAKPLYPRLQVPPNDGSFAMHTFLKEAVEYSEFAPEYEPRMWNATVDYAKATLPGPQRETWLSWLFNCFTGPHPPDVDLSGWLIALDYFILPHSDWSGMDLTAEEVAAVQDFLATRERETDEAGFVEAIEEARSAPLTDWDKRMHQAYEFVLFDRQRGNDPFLALKFANQGEGLRRAIRDHPFPDHFPHEALRQGAQALIDRRGVWMPEGRVLGPLTAVR